MQQSLSGTGETLWVRMDARQVPRKPARAQQLLGLAVLLWLGSFVQASKECPTVMEQSIRTVQSALDSVRVRANDASECRMDETHFHAA
jgi:hypothetical protein